MIEEMARTNLYALAKAYGKATGLTIPKVSRKVYGKTGFLADFKKGKQSITLSKMGGMFQDFSDIWPPDAPWPAMAPIPMDRPPARK